ncbi:ComEC/Rec2 family competence protein [Nocardia asteroides]|uniref:ComEC/Rec2 family competence protein n=1 Tax=Nocardia asteroides TaxID=1824 RepID=UPI001E600F7A|nr:ComEC/Rec2 family competence protein [Nocardia asteroides]UGT54137.1 ComEC/Rec2 family competence protein [Nocardia asteroides]
MHEDGRVAGERQVLDMRLVPAAVGCWVATIVAVSMGWVAGVVLAAGAVVIALGLWVVVLWAIAHERERWRVVAIAGLATMVLTAGFAAAGAWREHHVRGHPLRGSVGKSVTVLAAVTDDPKPMRAGGFGGQRRWIVHAGLREFGSGTATTRAGGAIVVLAGGDAWADLAPGQVIRFRARVSEPHRADLTVATLNALADPARHGEPPWWQRVAAGIRADLAGTAARALPPDAAGLLPALVVGDTTALSDEVRDSFETAGLQHLCVVSGANFTILLTALLALTRLLTAGPRVSAAAAAGVVVVFIVLARPDPSVLRAAAMGSVTVLALLTGRRKQALPALGAAVIGLLVVAPGLAVSAGFALSVLATAGLILLAPSWADWLRARGWWRAPAEIVAVSAGAFVVTLPLMVGLSGRVSLVAIVANALVAPVVGVITVIGAVGAVVACLWSDAAVPVLWCARPPLWWLLSVADRMAAIPGASLSVPSGIGAGLVATVVVVVAVAALRWSKTRRLLAVGVLGVAIVLVPVRLWHPGWPPDGWVLAMCDVGQGDGLALSVGPGAAVVIDTGPDPRAIRRCLDRLRIDSIPLLVLTHPHADHIDGLAGALRGRTIDAIATAPGELNTSGGTNDPVVSAAETRTEVRCDACRGGAEIGGESGIGSETASHRHGHGEEAGGIERVVDLAESARISLIELHDGLELHFGAVRVEVLAPSRDAPSSFDLDGANDRSLVLRAQTTVGTILFTGDIEEAAQTRLLDRDIRADILKIPHHGSRTTTPAFLRAVHPRLALISAGADNTFGHPHPAVTTALDALGTTVARTDRHGDVIVSGTAADLRTVTARR